MRFWMLEGEIEASASAALPLLRSALADNGATILDARQLGGLALVLQFECGDEDVAPILGALSAALSIRQGREGPSGDEVDIRGSPHATLVGSGDEKIDIPMVPG